MILNSEFVLLAFLATAYLWIYVCTAL